MPILVIAIGNGGCNVADTLYDLLPDGSHKFAMIDNDGEELRKHKATSNATLLSGNYAEIEAGMAQLLGGNADNKVTVIVCLGGETGSHLAPVAMRMASKIVTCVKCVVMMPFAFEGISRKARAEAALSKIRECASDVVVIHNDEIFNKYPDLNICDAFRQIDHEVAKTIENDL